jgi:hypothetical protein
MFKDVQLAIRAANSFDIDMPATTATAGSLYAGINHGWADLDFSAVAKFYERPEDQAVAPPEIKMEPADIAVEQAVNANGSAAEENPASLPAAAAGMSSIPPVPAPQDEMPAVVEFTTANPAGQTPLENKPEIEKPEIAVVPEKPQPADKAQPIAKKPEKSRGWFGRRREE